MSASPILRILDFADEIIQGKDKAQSNIVVLATYCLCSVSAMFIWAHMSDKDFSFVLTLSNGIQMLAFFLLLHQVRQARSVIGVSSKMLQVYAMVFVFRLSSTMVKNGYLPVDRTGDWLYQSSDIASLLLVCQLLYYVHKRCKSTYQEELDTFPIWKMVPAVIMFGCCVHGDLNHSPFFDKTWTIAMNLDTFAMLPQLWMLINMKGGVKGLTANFVVLVFFSRCLSFLFWYTGYPELAPLHGGRNVVGNLILGNHGLQLIFSGNFMYQYFQRQAQLYRSDCSGQEKTNGMVLPVGNFM